MNKKNENRSSLEDLVLTKENLFRNSLQDGYLKIMMNYSQYLIVLINLDLNWFGVVKSIFIVQTTSLGANYKMISFDCMMKGFYLKLVNYKTLINL